MLKWLIVLILLLAPVGAQATVFWEDGFEYVDQPTMAFAWDGASCVGDTTILAPTTTRPRTGAKSLQSHFTGIPPTYEGGGSCFFGGRSFQVSSSVFMRFWMYLTDHAGTGNFLPATPTTKILKTFGQGHPFSVYWVMIYGTTTLVATIQHNSGNGENVFTSGSIPQQQWVCVETQTTTNSGPGVANGIIRAWINGTPVLNDTSRVLLESVDTGTYPGTKTIGAYTQNGLGRIFYDDLAVGDTRIGCGATPPPGDTIPPPQVPTLTAVGGNALANLSWTTVVDNSGGTVTYLVQRATASGGPYATVATVTATSYNDIGLTNATTYYWRVYARDPSGNVSTLPSPVASATPTAPAGGSATVLSILSDGKFALNGVPKFLLCFSYYDISNYKTADIDALAADGFNCLTAVADSVYRATDEAGANTNSAYNANGTMKAAKVTAIEAAIDYADSKGMIVDLTCMLADIDGNNTAAWITVAGDRTTGMTNCINSFKANGNIMFSLWNEHNYGSVVDTHAEVGAFMVTARAACPTCILFYSSSDNIGVDADAHIWTTRSGSVVDTANVNAELADGVNVIAPHDDRQAGWNLLTTARVANLRAYLNSIGRQNVAILMEEPGREGSGGLGSAALYITTVQDAKAAGASGWDFHNDAAFDLDPTQAIPNQTDAVEEAFMDAVGAALAGGAQTRDTALVTLTCPGTAADIGAAWDAGYTNHFAWKTVSDRCRTDGIGQESYESTNTAVQANSWIQADLPTLVKSGSESGVRLGFLAAPANLQGYECRYEKTASDTIRIVRKDSAGASPATLFSTTGTPLTAPGVPSCERVGSTIKAYWNGTLIGTAIDTTYSGVLRPAFYGYSSASASDIEMDNVTAGNFTVAPVYVTPRILTNTASLTGLTVTSSGSIASYRVDTDFGSTSYTLAQMPSGVLLRTWVVGETFVCVFAVDAVGVVNTVSTDYICDSLGGLITFPDITAPTMSTPFPSAEIPFGTTSYNIGFNVSEPAECRIATTNIAFSAMTLTMTVSSLTASYTATVGAGLNNFYAQCRDFADTPNTTTTALNIPVTVAASTADVTNPSTVANAALTVISPTQLHGTWDIATDAGGISGYQVHLSAGACSTYTLAPAPVTTNLVDITGLAPSTTYCMKIKAIDASLNVSTNFSNIATVATPATPDITPPTPMTQLRTLGIFANSVVVTWDGCIDTQSSTYKNIEQCQGSGCTTWTVPQAPTTLDALVIGLAPSTLYSLRGICTDGAGNEATAYSNTLEVTTLASGLPQPRLQVPFGVTRPAADAGLPAGTRLPRP
jgi:hypothetical protein